MTLGELIEELSKHPRDKIVARGFGHPHSYRGDYSELAFRPVNSTTVGDMLDAAKEADGTTYDGYKGGEFTMGFYTPVHIAEYGNTGEEIGPMLLGYMLGDVE